MQSNSLYGHSQDTHQEDDRATASVQGGTWQAQHGDSKQLLQGHPPGHQDMGVTLRAAKLVHAEFTDFM